MKIKRTLSLLLAMLLCMSMLAGCAKSEIMIAEYRQAIEESIQATLDTAAAYTAAPTATEPA